VLFFSAVHSSLGILRSLNSLDWLLQMVLRGNGGDTSPVTSSPWSIIKGSQVETAVEHVSVV
jgi:hypothetical protein